MEKMKIHHKRLDAKNSRYRRIIDLIVALYDIQNQQSVKHEFKELLIEKLSSRRYIDLTDLLIKQITLLNRPYRIKENGSWKSEKEDLVIVLNLLQGELQSETLLNPNTLLALEQLQRVFGYDRVFKRADVERVTKYKKTQSQRLINRLINCNKLICKGGYENKGYFYQLI